MDGVLLVDKPAGPTSHDVVARLRRSSGERNVGHTGTLDPLATGLLPVVFGRATRLATFLLHGDKTYEATIRLGVSTDTHDAAGRHLSTGDGTLPDDATIARALEAFRGTFEQQPPSFSARRIDGERAYSRARRRQTVDLRPTTVTVHALERLSRDGDRLVVRIHASAGFYVRALARDLGDRLGCGAHLAALRRTGSGAFQVESALALEEAERRGTAVADCLISPAAALPSLPSVELTAAGLRRAVHGNPLGPEHFLAETLPLREGAGPVRVRILGPEGRLVALAEPRGAALHPVVVLG
jgi:tRNA pseudouridine55 synthase